MFKRLIQHYILTPEKIAGIEIRLGDDGNAVFDYVVLEQKSGKANIIDRSEHECSWEQLLQQLPKGIPVGIVVDGKGVLVKKGPPFAGNPADALLHILPNIQLSEFAFQSIPLSDSNAFALVRVEILNQYIRLLGDTGHRVLSCDLAFFGLAQTLSILTDALNPLHTARWNIIHHGGTITDFQPDKEQPQTSLSIAGALVSSRHILAFISGLQILLDTESVLQNAPLLDAARKDYRFERLFRIGGILFLTVISIVLLLNTFFFFQYNKQLEQQMLTLAVNEKQLVYVDSLQKLYREKQQFLEGNSLMRSSLTAWYADQIGASIIEGIRLSELQIFPAEPTSTKSKEADRRFQSDLIRIKGSSRQSTDLNRWLKALELRSWVKEVKVLPYSENREGKGEFELEVYVKSNNL